VPLNAGTPVLITGAAGGMGLLLVQLATARGAREVVGKSLLLVNPEAGR
jgi:NADPH:quinone reductase-like Zn-dependent oxidoreductase